MPNLVDHRRVLGRAVPITTIALILSLIVLAYATPPRNVPYVIAGAFVGLLLFAGDLYALRHRPNWILWITGAILVADSIVLNTVLSDRIVVGGADFILHVLVAVTTQFALLVVFQRRLLAWLNNALAP